MRLATHQSVHHPRCQLFDQLTLSLDGAVLHLRLNRPAKRNAISDTLIAQIHAVFVQLPEGVRAVVVSGEGEHFCAGLDLSELVERDTLGAVMHSRSWHACFDAIALGRVPVVAVLHANYANSAASPVFLQSFEVGNLQYLRTRTELPLVQLLNVAGARPYDFVVSGDPRTYGDLITPAGLDFINDYARGVGTNRDLLIPRPGNVLGATTSAVFDAHAAGLLVHAWTFRAENQFLVQPFRRGTDPAGRGDLEGEIAAALRLGIDGFFTDFPATGVLAVKEHP